MKGQCVVVQWQAGLDRGRAGRFGALGLSFLGGRSGGIGGSRRRRFGWAALSSVAGATSSESSPPRKLLHASMGIAKMSKRKNRR
ncbi:MAG: hypothetical protein HC802_11305 [Caldilineaceae bacterium]|nr:hypothetical protein [Caldilineaceae bacterium]